MVIWTIGLSGAGKTTLSEAVVAAVRAQAPNVVLLDGDVVRETFGNDLGHSMEDRRANAARMVALSRWLDGEGIHVVCAILSLFPEHRAQMREMVRDYYEVYIEAPLPQLQARDVKGLYGRYARGETDQVAGLDLEFIPPASPDLHIRNDAGEAALLAHVAPLAARMLGA